MSEEKQNATEEKRTRKKKDYVVESYDSKEEMYSYAMGPFVDTASAVAACKADGAPGQYRVIALTAYIQVDVQQTEKRTCKEWGGAI